MAKHGILVLGLVLTACAGSHGDDGEAGSSGTAGSPGPAGTNASGSEGRAGSGATGSTRAGSAAAGRSGGGAAACVRTPAKHHPMAEMCDRARERAPSSVQPEPYVGCKSDAECTQGENGRCGPNNRGVRTCYYDQCFADADCMQGPCICGKSASDNNRCYMGNCRTDADCGAAGYCSPSFGTCGSYSGVVGYYCHTCKDECIDDTDCAGNGYCAYEPTVGHWKCSDSQCVG